MPEHVNPFEKRLIFLRTVEREKKENARSWAFIAVATGGAAVAMAMAAQESNYDGLTVPGAMILTAVTIGAAYGAVEATGERIALQVERRRLETDRWLDPQIPATKPTDLPQ